LPAIGPGSTASVGNPAINSPAINIPAIENGNGSTPLSAEGQSDPSDFRKTQAAKAARVVGSFDHPVLPMPPVNVYTPSNRPKTELFERRNVPYSPISTFCHAMQSQ
jgi:hypothetical protein